MSKILYVYAIGESLSADRIGGQAEAVDGSKDFSVVNAGSLSALVSHVDSGKFSQEEIDRRAGDVAWLGEIGFRHQNVLGALARKISIIPLRAFTLFSSDQTLRDYLKRESASLRKILGTIQGKDEWTMRLEFDHEQWSKAIVRRTPSLRQMSEEAEKTSAGRGYLLRKKLDEERKKAAKAAEEELLGEIERGMREWFAAPMIVENRQQRAGSFPQITLLLEKKRAEELREIHQKMAKRYVKDGVRVVLTGPWPPYSFASEANRG